MAPMHPGERLFRTFPFLARLINRHEENADLVDEAALDYLDL